MDAYKNLKDEFNIDEIEEEAEASVANTAEKLDVAAEEVKSQKYTLEDKRYLITELQDLIASDREIMEMLKDMVLNGTAMPAQVMAYATISKSVRENIAKLSDIEKEITDYQVTESNEKFREKTLESKERLAEKRLAARSSSNNTPGQLTQNNTYIFNPKEQFEIMKNTKIEPIEIEEPKFDLS